MRQADSLGFRGGLGGMIRDSKRSGGGAVIGFFVIYDFFTVFQDAATKVDVLVVKFAHFTSGY